MNLHRMLEKCERDQWSVEDLDWSVKPKSMSRSDEISIVQYFTDMSGIERLAKALFQEQRRRTDDRLLQKIFSSFVVDEERHAVAAEMLAEHYNVHGYKDYEQSESLVRFGPPFLSAIKNFSAEVANAYILAGELILDVALLRSINDHVDDSMSHQAMRLINRDESRHIAIDYHMAEYYASDEYQAWLDEQPRKTLRQHRVATLGLAKMLYYAKPFFRDVFFEPMSMVDPKGERLREAFKRFHIIANKPGVAKRAFPKFMVGMQEAYNRPMIRRWVGPAILRIVGVPGEMLIRLYSPEELRRAAAMSFDELADEALEVKNAN